MKRWILRKIKSKLQVLPTAKSDPFEEKASSKMA
jgi:hypothetical protein